MFSTIKNHPFAVEAFFRSSVVLTYAAPRADLQRLIPSCLELDTFQDEWAFLAVAMVDTSALRPKGFPPFLGQDFFLIGYRIFVCYHSQQGKRLRGLYILRSETDRKRMKLLGNFFTHYQYEKVDLNSGKGFVRAVGAGQAKSSVLFESRVDDNVSLPEGSPFTTWKEARRFAGPLPFTFSMNEKPGEVVIVEGVREHWTPKPLHVHLHQFDFFEKLGLTGLRLANAFQITNVPYHWKKGRIEKWKQ